MELVLLIVGGFVGVAADRIWEWASRYWTNVRPAGSLWGWTHDEDSPTHVVISTCPADDQSEYTDTVYPQEARAAAEIESYLKGTLNTSVRLALSGRVGEAINDNLVVIGGPKHNQVTRRVLSDDRIALRFDDHVLVHEPTGQTWEAKVERFDERDWIVEDYALVVRTRNPFNPRRFMLIIAGSRTHGCLAGARSLIRSNVRTTAARVAGLGEQYALVVKVVAHHDVLGKPEVVAEFALPG